MWLAQHQERLTYIPWPTKHLSHAELRLPRSDEVELYKPNGEPSLHERHHNSTLRISTGQKGFRKKLLTWLDIVCSIVLSERSMQWWLSALYASILQNCYPYSFTLIVFQPALKRPLTPSQLSADHMTASQNGATSFDQSPVLISWGRKEGNLTGFQLFSS